MKNSRQSKYPNQTNSVDEKLWMRMQGRQRSDDQPNTTECVLEYPIRRKSFFINRRRNERERWKLDSRVFYRTSKLKNEKLSQTSER